ncbi:NUDIX hydrolase [Nocardioides bruguierae]|uniref:NUDIX hydrolase n=1 Tax=Nocardioides bruguierae TaxID=2945102 RepID=UPI0020223139|nr:NUDIX hydrolase [Nocardioides bruguierae]MCL8024724.1 NUDIX hydrolase [Nocardioides bruguierae]
MTSQPTLTDGTVTLRPARSPDPSRLAFYVVLGQDQTIGTTTVVLTDPGTAALGVDLSERARGHGYSVRSLRMLVDWCLAAKRDDGLGLERVEAWIPENDERALIVATRVGMRREGVRRRVRDGGEAPEGHVVLARLATDPPLTEPGAFRSLLNSFLPRKRAIAQMLVRSSEEGEPRVLMCQLTYKTDWDLPGGVVEVNESPRVAVAREVEEELSLTLDAGRLLLTDWLPPWNGWDDALCLVFDGGTIDPGDLDGLVLQAREIRSVRLCTLAEVREHATDFTARRVEAALAGLRGEGPGYTESGHAL